MSAGDPESRRGVASTLRAVFGTAMGGLGVAAFAIRPSPGGAR